MNSYVYNLNSEENQAELNPALLSQIYFVAFPVDNIY